LTADKGEATQWHLNLRRIWPWSAWILGSQFRFSREALYTKCI
jgi:hypothetical protein